LSRLRFQSGTKALDIGFVDLLEGAVALQAVAHAVGEDVVGILDVVFEIVKRLGLSGERGKERRLRRLAPGGGVGDFCLNLEIELLIDFMLRS